MTPDPLQKRTSTRQKRLALVAALTLAATAWAALQPDEAAGSAPFTSPQATNTTPGRALGSRAREDSAASAPAAHPLSWPDSSQLATRSPWRAALPQGVAAWSGPPPPALRHAAPVASHAPASAVAVAVAVATPPPVPAFPYQLIGRLDDGIPQALLSSTSSTSSTSGTSGTSRSFGVKAGDSIDGQWRVDSVEARSVTVTWLRTGARKTLSFASS